MSPTIRSRHKTRTMDSSRIPAGAPTRAGRRRNEETDLAEVSLADDVLKLDVVPVQDGVGERLQRGLGSPGQRQGPGVELQDGLLALEDEDTGNDSSPTKRTRLDSKINPPSPLVMKTRRRLRCMSVSGG